MIRATLFLLVKNQNEGLVGRELLDLVPRIVTNPFSRKPQIKQIVSRLENAVTIAGSTNRFRVELENVLVVGSASTGMWLNKHSLLDLMVVTNPPVWSERSVRVVDVEFTTLLCQRLATEGFVKIKPLIFSHPPAVHFHDQISKLSCAVYFNREDLYVHSQLINQYCAQHEIVRSLGILVMRWAIDNGCHVTCALGNPSSLTWVTLVLHYLMHCESPLLEQINVAKIPRDMSSRSLDATFSFHPSSSATPTTNSSKLLEDHFRGFFEYFSSMPETKFIRLMTDIPDLADPSQKLSRGGLKQASLQYIVLVIRDTHAMLRISSPLVSVLPSASLVKLAVPDASIKAKSSLSKEQTQSQHTTSSKITPPPKTTTSAAKKSTTTTTTAAAAAKATSPLPAATKGTPPTEKPTIIVTKSSVTPMPVPTAETATKMTAVTKSLATTTSATATTKGTTPTQSASSSALTQTPSIASNQTIHTTTPTAANTPLTTKATATVSATAATKATTIVATTATTPPPPPPTTTPTPTTPTPTPTPTPTTSSITTRQTPRLSTSSSRTRTDEETTLEFLVPEAEMLAARLSTEQLQLMLHARHKELQKHLRRVDKKNKMQNCREAISRIQLALHIQKEDPPQKVLFGGRWKFKPSNSRSPNQKNSSFRNEISNERDDDSQQAKPRYQLLKNVPQRSWVLSKLDAAVVAARLDRRKVRLDAAIQGSFPERIPRLKRDICEHENALLVQSIAPAKPAKPLDLHAIQGKIHKAERKLRTAKYAGATDMYMEYKNLLLRLRKAQDDLLSGVGRGTVSNIPKQKRQNTTEASADFSMGTDQQQYQQQANAPEPQSCRRNEIGKISVRETKTRNKSRASGSKKRPKSKRK